MSDDKRITDLRIALLFRCTLCFVANGDTSLWAASWLCGEVTMWTQFIDTMVCLCMFVAGNGFNPLQSEEYERLNFVLTIFSLLVKSSKRCCFLRFHVFGHTGKTWKEQDQQGRRTGLRGSRFQFVEMHQLHPISDLPKNFKKITSRICRNGVIGFKQKLWLRF